MMSLSRNHNFSKIYGKWMNMDTWCRKQYRKTVNNTGKNTFCHCQNADPSGMRWGETSPGVIGFISGIV